MTSPYYGFVYQRSKNSSDTAGDGWNSNRYDSASDSTSSPVKIGPVNQGVWGVTVTISSGSITGTETALEPLSSHRLYQLCLKCHSYWAWGDTQGDNANQVVSPSTQKTWTGEWTGANRGDNDMTDVAYEFRTNLKAYHPVFAGGKNKPEDSSIRNPCWCAGTVCPPTTTSYETNNEKAYGTGACTNDNATAAATGTRTDLSGADIATLSQTFVPPWRHDSLITCVDCHEDDSDSTPRGPHGSSRPFILRDLDTSITYARTGTSAYIYSSELTGADLNVFCFNCHRADVYLSEDEIGASGTYPLFARLGHPADCADYGGKGGCRATDSTTFSLLPNGIVCLGCHGGSVGFLGGIHGNDYTADLGPCSGCTDSARLITVTGTHNTSGDWLSYTKAAVGTVGTCTKAAAGGIFSSSNFCGNAQDGDTSEANYNY
jgi:hypothetical protein